MSSKKHDVMFPPMMTTLSSKPSIPKSPKKPPSLTFPKVSKKMSSWPPSSKDKPMVVWTLGMPSPKEVAKHERQHPFKTPLVGEQGAIWLCIDREGSLGPRPQLIHLRVGLKDEEVWQASNASVGREKACYEKVAGRVLIANGGSFWQLLEECRWAQRSEYTPVTAEGIPITMV